MLSIVLLWVLELLVCGCLPKTVCGEAAEMDTVFTWKFADISFPDQSTKEEMIRNGSFIPENAIMNDVDVWEGGEGVDQKIFVTIPKMMVGVPVSVATVSSDGSLEPYPNWNWYRVGDCNGISSVYRVEVDQCNRLWLLDSAKVEGSTVLMCTAKILIFDLNDDSLIMKYEFPKELVNDRAALVTIAVDIRDGKCSEAFAYITDVINSELIVFDLAKLKSWKVKNSYFNPDPLSSHFVINGATADFKEGLIGLALGPIKDNDRLLYFHSLSSVHEFWVLTSVIRNETLSAEGDNALDLFHISNDTRPSQSVAEVMSSAGIMYFPLLSENSIVCWNPQSPYTRENIVTIAKNEDEILFTSGIKLRNGNIWIMTTTMLEILSNNMSEDKVNFRIMKGNAEELVSGTNCDMN